MDEKMLLAVLLKIFLVCQTTSYYIHRDNCRRYSLFKLSGTNTKVTGGVILSIAVNSSSNCVRQCLGKPQCQSINFKPYSLDKNCEILNNRKVTGQTSVAAGWKYYEPVRQTVTPGCMLLGGGNACSPGYRCEDICSGSKRFNCIDINECESNPCKNGGTCLNQINKYQCNCAPGYTGVNCQEEINECASSPCVYGACTDHVNYFSCSCQAGYNGDRCQYNINECASSPCVHGSCHDQVNYFTCSCNAGYHGSRCQYDVNECSSNPCIRGSCNNHVNRYSCSCPWGWVGSRCECLVLCGKK